MWQEIARRVLRIDKVSDAHLIFFENNMLVVRHNKGIYIFEISTTINISKNLEFTMSFIPNSTSSPVRDLSDLKNLTNANMTEMIVDTAYWSNNKQMSQDMLRFVTSEWIPSGYLNADPLLATLNNVGNVTFYKPGTTDWVNVLDLSAVIVKKFGPEPQSIKTFSKLKKFVDLLETSSICLGPQLDNYSCYFVTAQRGGNIYIWKITAVSENLEPELIFEINQDTDEIVSMISVPISENKFSIICCNVLGQLFNLKFRIDNTSVALDRTTCFWEHKDRMICTYVSQKIVNKNILLICNKNRHFVAFLFDFEGNLLSQVVHNVNDYKISNIKERNGSYYVTASNSIFQVDINCNENLQLEVQPLDIEQTNADFSLYGFALSENSVIAVTLVYDASIKYKARPTVFKLIFYTKNIGFGIETDILFQNESKMLHYVWDCIELIRYKIIKQKMMPDIDYNELYREGQEDMYKLKVYYVLLIIYNIVIQSSRVRIRNLLPETSEETIKGMITVLHAKKHLINLYDKHKTHNKLDQFELESFVATKKYLQYYCRVNKRDINDYVPNNVLYSIKKDWKYECQCCDEIINGITCSNGHLNMFCSLSFMPIDGDNYLVCEKCKATAIEELYHHKPRCIFCDNHLKYSCQ